MIPWDFLAGRASPYSKHEVVSASELAGWATWTRRTGGPRGAAGADLHRRRLQEGFDQSRRRRRIDWRSQADERRDPRREERGRFRDADLRHDRNAEGHGRRV